MKLYELHRGERFMLNIDPVMPPDISTYIDRARVYRLNNIDGMYSNVSDAHGNTYHFAAWTEVDKVV